MTNRLDLELQRQLRPVDAPEELWARIQTRTRAKHTPNLRWLAGAFAGAAIVLCCLMLRSNATGHLAKTAAQELAARSERVDFRSNDPAQIRAWVRSRAGMDVPLASAGSVRFLGVALLQESPCVVCVSYRIGGKRGDLVIARGGSRGPKHSSMQHLSSGNASILAWAAAGQTYVVAAPVDNLQLTCSLCHIDNAHAARFAPSAS